MIHSFTCKNFYSFDEAMGVDFRVDKKAPNNHSYNVSKSGTRLSLVEAVVGPNASGKTNLLKVLPMVKWLIVDSFALPESAEIPVKAFMPLSEDTTPTELSVVFDINEDVYEYEVHLTTERIHLESLVRKSRSSQRLTNKTLIKRTFIPETQSYKLEMKGFSAPPGFSKVLREKVTVLSAATRLNHPLSMQISAYWTTIDFNVTEAGWLGDHAFNSQITTSNALHFYQLNSELKERAEEMLSRYDLGFAAFEFQERNNQIVYNIAHNFGDKRLSLPLEYESSGTKQLFIILKTILLALASGGLAVLDEFDARLHPDMVEELIGLFTDPITNPRSAQILFSTHSHRVLAKLDKYQIILTEKNAEGSTDVWRLDEMKGVRADDNYFAKYMSGAYGAIPNFE